jgi:hypothetical protein
MFLINTGFQAGVIDAHYKPKGVVAKSSSGERTRLACRDRRPRRSASLIFQRHFGEAPK